MPDTIAPARSSRRDPARCGHVRFLTFPLDRALRPPNAPHDAGVMRSRTRSFAFPTVRSARRTALALLSCTALSCNAPRDGGGTMRIGIAADLKRPNMQTVFRGVELAVEQLNAEGSGRRFEIAKPPATATGAVEI